MKKHRTSVNHTSAPEYTLNVPFFDPQLWRNSVLQFLSTKDVGNTCAAFDWALPMGLFKDRVQSNLHHYAPDLLEGLSDIVSKVGKSDSIVIAGGSVLSALYGAVDVNCDVDIWCEKSENARICQLLVSEGYVMSRISTRYGMFSSSLISHVETYYELPHEGAILLYRSEEEGWIYSDETARKAGQGIINYALNNNRCNRLLQFSNVDRTTLDLLFEPRLLNSLYLGTKVDLIVGKSDKTPEEVIRGSFDLTSCLVRYSIGGDLKMEFPTFTLAKTSLLCPSENRIVMMHYMHRLIDLSHLPNEAAIKKFVRVQPWFRPMFNRHRSEILLTLEGSVNKGGFFSRYLDRYSEYRLSEYCELSMADQEFRRTIWIVVYYVRHYMIVDALRHVASLQIGFVQHPSFRYDHDGTCDWAIKTHNIICYSKNVDRLIKYAHRGVDIKPILDIRVIHNREVVRNLHQL